MGLKVLLRLIYIYWVVLRYRLRSLINPKTHKSLARNQNKRIKSAAQLRQALELLGPIFIKFGQVLSTRRDLIPHEFADELAKLQDRVKPFPSALAKALIEASLGRSINEVFASFDDKPLAAASIAQVHAATLKDGAEVVVKVLRPNVDEMIARDLEVLDFLANTAAKRFPDATRLKPKEIVNELRMILSKELDLIREASNASQLKKNFEGSDKLYVPEVYWDYCRPNVMVLERIHGVQISNIKKLREVGADLEWLAHNGVEIFFTQVFRHNFFHADMHPGNVFVDITNPKKPRYMAIDFGVMGTLTLRDKHYLAENFYAFFNRDYRRVADLHIESGWVPPDTSAEDLEASVRSVCEPMFNKPLKEISFGIVLLRLFDIARKYKMEIQPQLILLQKTLVNVEGLGRELYPDLDIWKTAKPVLEKWLMEQSSPINAVKRIIKQWPQIMRDLSLLPERISAFLKTISQE